MEGQYPISLIYQLYAKDKQQFLRPSDRSDVWIMFAVEEGLFAFTIGDVSGEATSGDIVICPPDTECRREIKNRLSYHYYKFNFRASEEAKIKQTKDLLRNLFAYKFTPNERDRLFNNFRHLTWLSALNDADSSKWREHFVSDIWLLFRMEAENYAQYSNLAGDPLMRKAKEMIERHAFREFRMKDVAELLEIQPAQLTRRFQHVFGISPSRYLFGIRMEKAKSLLQQTDYTIDHVAQLCGYDNGFYFSRMFTQYTRMNPSHYRKDHVLLSP